MITQEHLKSILKYSPATGLFTWVAAGVHKSLLAGRVTSCRDVHGYVQINIKGDIQKGHRLAWLYMTGEYPNGQIDHINHVRDDNRWCNLRVVDNATNHRNRPKQSNNKSGFVGVSYNCKIKKWRSYITVNGSQKHIGSFEKIEDAISARSGFNVLHGYHANHGLTVGRPKYTKLAKELDDER